MSSRDALAKSAELLLNIKDAKFILFDNTIAGVDAGFEKLMFSPVQITSVPETINKVLENMRKKVRSDIEAGVKAQQSIDALLDSDLCIQAIEMTFIISLHEGFKHALMNSGSQEASEAAILAHCDKCDEQNGAVSLKLNEDITKKKRLAIGILLKHRMHASQCYRARAAMLKFIPYKNWWETGCQDMLRFTWEDGVQV